MERHSLYAVAFGNQAHGAAGDDRQCRTTSLLPLLQGRPLNVCGKPQIFSPQALKPSEMCFTGDLGAHLANHVQMASQKSTLNINFGAC